MVSWVLVLLSKICSFYGLWVYLRDTRLNSSRIAPQREWDYPGFSKDSPLAKWSIPALFARCKTKKEAQKFRPRQNSDLRFRSGPFGWPQDYQFAATKTWCPVQYLCLQSHLGEESSDWATLQPAKTHSFTDTLEDYSNYAHGHARH